MNEQSGVKLFDEDKGMALAAQSDAAAVARATQEVQAALVIAQRYGRDVIKCKSKIAQACQRKELAEVAEYEYSRGGTRITGPTIDLLRAIANRWGNLRYGWTEVERRDGISSIRCFAWDLETNTQAERTFSVKHWRDTKQGGYKLEDERDIYELLANSAARRVRACLEEVIDADAVNAAIDQCRETLRSGEKTPLVDRAVKMLVPFAEFGVTQAMIETRLGNKLDAVSENQLASLRRVYKSLKDGVGKREDYFKPDTAKPEFTPKSSETAGKPAPQSEPASEERSAFTDEGEGSDLGPQTETRIETKGAGAQPELIQGNGANYLKGVRGLCKLSRIKESTLLGFLTEIGATDGSAPELDNLPLNVLQMVYDQWSGPAGISGRILAATKGASK